MRRQPRCYMQRCCGTKGAKGAISIEDAPEVISAKVADPLRKDVGEGVVAFPDKPRHREPIDQILSVGSRVVQVAEGYFLAFYEVIKLSYLTFLLRVGGAPEGCGSGASKQCREANVRTT